MHITVFDNVYAKHGDALETTADDLLRDLQQTASIATQPDAKHTVPCWSIGRYKDDAPDRTWQSLDKDSTTGVFVYDIDSMSAEALAEALPSISQHDVYMYSTFSHTDDAPRYRLVVKLNAEVRLGDPLLRTYYINSARELGITIDTAAVYPAHLQNVPQHKEGNQPDSARYKGKSLTLDGTKKPDIILAEIKHLARPERADLKKLVTKLKKRHTDTARQLVNLLTNILKAQPYLTEGERHTTTATLAFALVMELGPLDGAWFAETYLMPCWGADLATSQSSNYSASKDWADAVTSAINKYAEQKAEAAEAQNDLLPPPADDTVIARATKYKSALVVSLGNSYYVYDARADIYRGPLTPNEVPVVFRDALGNVPGISGVYYKDDGPPTLKSAARLSYEYGRKADNVCYYSALNNIDFWSGENRTLYIPAYHYTSIKPQLSDVADDLLRTLGGDLYKKLETYLCKFCDLTQPLPALALVGPRRVWKSKLGHILSRFWGDSRFAQPCDATKVMGRFSDGLLKNPVVFSDEDLARDERGRPIPEKYRSSIMSTIHMIEKKGCAPVALYSALRHIMAVNDESRLFPSELDLASVEATLERFLVIIIDGDAMAEFEKRWSGTQDILALREGAPLLRHVKWLEANITTQPEGRLYVHCGDNDNSSFLKRAKFSNDQLYYCIATCIEALENEEHFSSPGTNLDRLPLWLENGAIKLSPIKLNKIWGTTNATKDVTLRKPTPTWIGRILTGVGLKKHKNQKARNQKNKGWDVDEDRLKEIIETFDTVNYDFIRSLLNKHSV